MPAVSICIPVFNGAKYLSAAIESVLAQTFHDWELLIADDCSADKSWSVIETYTQKDKRIKAWKNPHNLGHYPNYNACIGKATGKFIKLFAQDDLLHPTFVQRCVDVFEENPNVSLISTARHWIDGDGNKVALRSEIDRKLTRYFDSDTVVPGAEAIIWTLTDTTNWLGEPATQMYRAQFKDGGFDTAFNQIGDLEYNFRLLEKGDFYFIASYLCDFRKHLSSWTTVNSKQLITHLDWLLLGSRYRKYLDKAGISSEKYCLDFMVNWKRNLEHELRDDNRLGADSRDELLRDFCGKRDPLSMFECPRNGERNITSEFQALGAMALLQSCLLEHELLQVHNEIARDYREETRFDDSQVEVRSGMVDALQGMKNMLRERDKELSEVVAMLEEMGSSVSWKLTEPLRKLKSAMAPPTASSDKRFLFF